MDIQEFFQLSAGKWFSQRTSHHLAFKQAETGKSDIKIELLSQDAPEVIHLCEQHSINPALAWGGVRVTWEGMMEGDTKKQVGSSVLVPIADAEHPHQGQVLRDGLAQKAKVAGRFVIGNDDVLTLITETETVYTEERLWFASPNLRLRTSLVKRADGFSMASFFSEIRMGVTQASAKAANAANA